MHRISVDPDGLTAGAVAAGLLAGDLSAAAAQALSAAPGLLSPALGLIGADFLTAYATAHATHLTTLGALATALDGFATTTADAGTDYVRTDRDRAAIIAGTSRHVSMEAGR